MEEIITLDGKQFKLTTDRPLTALERQQTMAQIRAQTGCSSCRQPRTLSAGFGDIYGMAPTCTDTKSSGDTITLAATPSGAIGPYHVRFFRKSAPGAYTELGTVRTIAEFDSTSTTISLVDADFTGAVGNDTAGVPTTDATGAITDPGDGSAALGAGKIRVATTTYDSCPTGAQSCVEYCDVNLACVAPTCNFVVT
jgi:hypothetical protein